MDGKAMLPIPRHGERVEYLDTVRGLAALSVVASHYLLAYNPPGWCYYALTYTPLHVLWDGFAAVSLFFVLSGLVLSFRYFRDPENPSFDSFRLGGYVVARVCRIWLPYLVVLLLSVPVWYVNGHGVVTKPAASNWTNHLWVDPPTLATVAAEASLPAGWAKYVLLPQGWTLHTELVLSLLVPAGALLASRRTSWLLFTAAVMVWVVGFDTFAVNFAIGIALARNYQRMIRWLEPRPVTRSVLFLVGWVLYTWRYLFVSATVVHGGMVDWLVPAVGAAAFLAVTASTPWLRAVYSWGPLRRLGRISYSVYLCHIAILLSLTPRFMAVLRHRTSTDVAWFAGLVVTIGASLLVADVMYRLVEVPTMALGRWLSARIAALRPVRSGAAVSRQTAVACPVSA